MTIVRVEVSNKELDALEDLAVSWNLCDKHNSRLDAGEDDRWRFTQKCEKCVALNKKIRSNVLHLWSKLANAYDKSVRKR